MQHVVHNNVARCCVELVRGLAGAFRLCVITSLLLKFFISTSCSKSGLTRRSEREKYFLASDVKILGLSVGGENSLKVEFAVLFPSVEGQVPRPLPPTELVHILEKNKETIGEAVGGTITRITIGNNF